MRPLRLLRSPLFAMALVAATTHDAGHRAAPQELLPGKYHIMLVATGGSEVGARSVGILTLYPTSAADLSPARPNERARADTLEYPMYGVTDLNFARVGAPINYRGASAPAPTFSIRSIRECWFDSTTTRIERIHHASRC